MLCVKCQKRPAVVFVQRLENGKTVQEGYCLTCARAMHIQPVDDLMKQFGMSDQDLENMEERMSSFLQEASDSGMLAPMMNGDDTDAGDEPAPQDDFVPGGSPVFPFGFGARQNKDDAKPKNGKKEKAPRRKFLETYCENLTQKARDGKTDRIIGRDREIYRTIQILCRLPDRRGRCRQDCDCRGYRPAHCRGQGPRASAGQGNLPARHDVPRRRHPVPRPV